MGVNGGIGVAGTSTEPRTPDKNPYEVDTSRIDNSLLLDVTRMAVRDALVECTGVPYDPEGRSAETVQEFQADAVKSVSRHFFLYNIPHSVWVDCSGEEEYMWVIAEPEDGLRWHCQVCRKVGVEDRSPGVKISSREPGGVCMESEGVSEVEPWNSDSSWWWNPKQLTVV